LFFFSSRRRHTRSYGDWSSDVCSSDLLRRVKRLQELSKLTIPRWDNDRHGAVGFRLTSESNQRLRLGSIDIAELFDLFPLAHGHIGKFFSTADDANPARAA